MSNFIKNAEEKGQRAKMVPGYIRYSLVAISFAVAGYFIFKETGPAGWIARFQASLMDGKHFILLTYALTLILCLLPTGIIIRLLIPYFEGKKRGADSDLIDSDSINEENTSPEQ